MRDTYSAVARHIARTTGRPFSPGRVRNVGGGCINAASILEDEDRKYFVKLNDAGRLAMFEAEAEGLMELASARAVRVPQPVCWGTAGDKAYLVLEHLDLRAGTGAADKLGEQLARLHRRTQATFGWHRDNTIGSTPQINTPSKDWTEFWQTRRLGYQLELAAQQGYSGSLQRKGERLLGNVGAFFRDYRPVPSLLHGDLWGGNCAETERGEPVIFDPAVYYGDREADLAMTELFGGFGARFYASYRAAWALDAGYGVRKTLYNLYHVLNHLNLFGGGYGSQAERMMDSLLSELH